MPSMLNLSQTATIKKHTLGVFCYGGDDKARTCDLHDVNVAL